MLLVSLLPSFAIQERIVTPVQEPPPAPAPAPAGPVHHRYALLEAKRAAQRAAKTEWIDSMLMTRDANRSRLLQDTQRALSASSMRREQQHQQLLNQQACVIISTWLRHTYMWCFMARTCKIIFLTACILGC